MNRPDAYERILTVLQETALDGSDWPAADRVISEVGGTEGSALLLAEEQSGADAAVYLAEFSFSGQRRYDWERRYFKDYWPRDERRSRVVRLRNGCAAHTRDVYTAREKRTSATYNEALSEIRAQNGLYLRLDGPHRSHIVWALCDSTERGGWGNDQVRLFERLGPHVRQYVVVRHALAEAGVLGASASRLLENARLGSIGLDRRGRILTANDQARDFLRKGDRLHDRDGLLCARIPTEEAELCRLLARAMPPHGVRGAAGSMMVAGASPLTPLALHVTPVGAEELRLRHQRIAALVMVVDPSSRARIDPCLVQAVFGLTPAESRLAVALAAGDTLQEIARSTGHAEKTVRMHIEEILRKQGISRDVDLVRRVLSLESFPGPSC